MRSGFCRVLYLLIFLLSFPVISASYDVFTDESGDIYLKAPEKLIVVPQHKAIPVHVTSPNSLLRLFELNGVWQVQVLTKSEWSRLNLRKGSDIVEEVRRADFDDDGLDELFIALKHPTTSQLLISNFDNNPAVNASYFETVELAGVAQNTPVYSTFATIANPTINALSAGEFRVDESGSATYSMPLSLPDGIAGVVPQLAFSYSSSGGDGYMGSGWAFSGGSVIARCPKNLSVDTPLWQDSCHYLKFNQLGR
uniref:SpvB/TcaC N-terminal domain-containing protein n=1 Tax=Rheinheimera sp. TaxID=1869214 RepID=UPI004048C9B2